MNQLVKSARHQHGFPHAEGPHLLAHFTDTHACFAIESAPGVFLAVRRLPYESKGDIALLLRAYLASYDGAPVRHAALAISCPAGADPHQAFSEAFGCAASAMQFRLGLRTLMVADRLEALAMALPRLSAPEHIQVGGGAPIDNGVLALVCMGSGIDSADATAAVGLVPTADGYLAVGNKGGEVDFGPSDARGLCVLQYGRRIGQHVTYEQLVSLSGIELIYRALAEESGVAVGAANARHIIARAMIDSDPLCIEVLDVFCSALGSYGAYIAASFGAVSGVFIDCCVVPELRPWIPHSRFRQQFELQGPASAYIARIPTFLIATQDAVLHGLGSMLSSHLGKSGGASSLMERIVQLQRVSSPAERRVATVVLEQTDKILELPIADIALQAQVSEPTVIRFCRTLGFSGMRDFKLKFAGEFNTSLPARHRRVGAMDGVPLLSEKVINNTAFSILMLRSQIDPRAVALAINLIKQANRIDFYAAGTACVPALDGQYKLLRQRQRIPTAIYSDAHQFQSASERLSAGDLAIAITTGGSDFELLAAVNVARAAGAGVIAIAPNKTSLAKRATVCLGVSHGEDAGAPQYLPMISRFIQLVLIDILSVGLSIDVHKSELDGACESQRMHPSIFHREQ